MYDRSNTIGASDAPMIWQGEWGELYDRKKALPTDEPIELPLAARIGTALQGLHIDYFNEQTQLNAEPYLDEEHPFISRTDPYIVALPDALVRDWTALRPLEVKAVNPFWRPTNLLQKYMPQLQHQMRVLESDFCYFSVIYLNIRWESTVVWYDPIMDDQLLRMQRQFYWHLDNNIRPEM